MKKFTGNLKKMILLACLTCMVAAGFAQVEPVAVKAADSLETTVGNIVSKEVKQGDSTKKKLKKLFTYVQKNYDYARKTGFEAYNGWAADYAKEMFSQKKGSCYHYAAAYAFLAKKATGCEVRIGLGKTNGFGGNTQPHAWTEVKIGSKWYICDPNMDKYAANSSKKYCLKKRNGLKNTYDKFKGASYFSVSI